MKRADPASTRTWPWNGTDRAVTARLFLTGLALVYLAAFLSAGVQVEVLIGEEGLLPASQVTEALAEAPPGERLRRFPTFLWLAPGDAALHLHWILGTLAAMALLAGLAPRACLLVLWALYLSLTHCMQVFFSFQWDNLLLETGLVALFLAPGGLRPWRAGWRERHHWPAPSGAGVLLVTWLLFRLMFLSGTSKLLGGDPTWWDLTAMTWYFETAPLPTWLGWLAHQLPSPMLRGTTLLVLVWEILLPPLVFHPSRRVRRLLFAVLAAGQAGIFLTANYGFFNLLSLLLGVVLLRDDELGPLSPARREPDPGDDVDGAGGADDDAAPAGNSERDSTPAVASWRPWAGWALAGLLVAATLVEVYPALLRRPLPEPLRQARVLWAPTRSVNVYHLFASMTKTRIELRIEGRAGAPGAPWKTWDLRWKPGDPRQRPRFVAPHQPRVDFQMWFLPLRGRPLAEPWFRRLLEGMCTRPEVFEGLFVEAPFREEGPAWVRVRALQYRMAGMEKLREEGLWWEVEERGVLGPFRCPQGE